MNTEKVRLRKNKTATTTTKNLQKKPREGLGQNTEGSIQQHGKSDSKKEGLVDTSQPLYKRNNETAF